ncbi:MAG TPA: hypothetical protein VI818_08100 [Candidatus Thermoplasmatota archaeon]|nr:hypothetical protein [Candidatus Thermoplasmatota archaeon]
MKGYVMILYVNAAIFGFVSIASLGYGLVLHRGANECIESGGGEACQQERDAANAPYRVAPFLFAIGIVLFSIGFMVKPKAANDSPGRETTPATEPPPPAP